MNQQSREPFQIEPDISLASTRANTAAWKSDKSIWKRKRISIDKIFQENSGIRGENERAADRERAANKHRKKNRTRKATN
jgi:hypothetical protein